LYRITSELQERRADAAGQAALLAASALASTQASPTPAAGAETATAEGDGEDSNAAPEEKEFGDRIIREAIDAMLRQSAGGSTPGSKGADDAATAGKAARKSGQAKGGDTNGTAGEVSPEDAEQSKRLLNQARQAIKDGDFSAAADMLKRSITADPGNRQAYTQLALMQKSLGLTQDEMQTYKDWMEAMPKDSLPHYLLAGAYLRMGQTTEAYGELSQFRDMSNGSLPSYPMTASMLRQLGLRPEEKTTLEAWTNAAPASPDAHRALADFYRRSGNLNAALNEYQTVTSLTPGDISAYTNTGRIYQSMGMQTEAQAQYTAALGIRPNDTSVLNLLAGSYRTAGDFQAALDTYQNIVDLEPDSALARQAARNIAAIERRLSKP
jgi:tetratricopeptide (TPR) repeat protein